MTDKTLPDSAPPRDNLELWLCAGVLRAHGMVTAAEVVERACARITKLEEALHSAESYIATEIGRLGDDTHGSGAEVLAGIRRALTEGK
jgi:hypothetical protein